MSARQQRALKMLALVREQDVPRGVPLCTSLYDGLGEKEQRLHLLVALLISSQTKDQVTANAMDRFRQRGFNLENLKRLNEQEIQEIIYPVGFYRRKAASLVKVFKILESEYAGDVPESLEDCLKLPGIGPKMAHLLQSGAWGKTTGIGVDTHVHRLSQLWDWVKPSNNPETTREQLEKILPKELWFEVNELLVLFGQNICVPRAPKCDECKLNTMCKGSKVKKIKREAIDPDKNPKKRLKRVEIEYDKDDQEVIKKEESLGP